MSLFSIGPRFFLDISLPRDAAPKVDVSATARSVRFISPDLMEVRRSDASGLRMTAFGCFVILSTIVVWLPLLEVGKTAVRAWAVLDPRGFYEAVYTGQLENGRLGHDETFEAFLARRLADSTHTRTLEQGIISLVMIGIPLGLFLLWPRPAPLRVDRAGKAVYTKRYGRLIAVPITRGMVDIPGSVRDVFHRDGVYRVGILTVTLKTLGSGKPKRIGIGAFPSSHQAQHENVYNAIRSFAAARGTPDWVGELAALQSRQRPAPLRGMWAGVLFRVGFSRRDLAKIEAWRADLAG